MRNKIKICSCIIYNFEKEIYHHLGSLHGKLTENTFVELEHYYDNSSLFQIQFSKHTECDHSGVELVFSILGYVVRFLTYDNRHWEEKE